MSHYGEYIVERLGKLIEENEHGFAVYSYVDHARYGKVVYLEEIFVARESRQARVATQMADEIAEKAKALGIKVMLGSVSPDANGSTTSLHVLLGYGMYLDYVGNDGLIYFSKTLED